MNVDADRGDWTDGVRLTSRSSGCPVLVVAPAHWSLDIRRRSSVRVTFIGLVRETLSQDTERAHALVKARQIWPSAFRFPALNNHTKMFREIKDPKTSPALHVVVVTLNVSNSRIVLGPFHFTSAKLFVTAENSFHIRPIHIYEVLVLDCFILSLLLLFCVLNSLSD